MIVSAKFRRRSEQGFIITLVAVFMLFVVGAMAALSIDVVTFYTARSEAQLAADSAALAGARVLANSGMTSSTDPTLTSSALALCVSVGQQVGASNPISGQNTSVSVTCNASQLGNNNPSAKSTVTVSAPAFFARIWGTTQVTVVATAAAEAYNPSGGGGTSNTTAPPVASSCVKPWLLPNINPRTGLGAIFDSSGDPPDPALLGWTSTPTTPLQPACSSCTPGALNAWQFYPGDPVTTFIPPTSSLPTCNPALSNPYQNSIAGCIQAPISCVQTANIDVSSYSGDRLADTADAVNCLTHATSSSDPGGGDSIVTTNSPTAPFEFIVGSQNPVAIATPALVNTNALVSDSLVTVPIFDNGNGTVTATGNQLVGFVQLLLNSDGNQTQDSGSTKGQVKATVINLIGCVGLDANAVPVYGNGATAVPVRLISPQ
ncbi:MAG: pilus assembly protein TadG-related protein [Terriglobales bacterium]